jgi:2-oxoisovalerate dehydrogenase E1 component
VLEICSTAQEAVRHVRSEVKPGCLILHTYRFSAHSKGDDLRSPEELADIYAFDPLKLHSPRLTSEEQSRAESEAMVIVEDAFVRADADLSPRLDVTD